MAAALPHDFPAFSAWTVPNSRHLAGEGAQGIDGRLPRRTSARISGKPVPGAAIARPASRGFPTRAKAGRLALFLDIFGSACARGLRAVFAEFRGHNTK